VHISAPLWRALRRKRLHPSPRAEIRKDGGQWRIAGPLRAAYIVAEIAGKLNVYPARPPWDELLRVLATLVGVEDVRIEEVCLAEDQFQSARPVVDTEQYARTVIVTFNCLNITEKQLAAAIGGVGGLTPGRPERIERIGKPITIPQDLPV